MRANLINEILNFERKINPMDSLRLGRIVWVKGDRGVGDYQVRFISQYFGPSIMEGEEIWKVRDINSGNLFYVVKYPDNSFNKEKFGDKFWGEIDPFINQK